MGGRFFYWVDDEGGVCGMLIAKGGEIGVGAIPKCLSADLLPSTQVPAVLPADIS